MKSHAGRPIKSGKLEDFKNPKLVFVEKCSKNSYWYKEYVNQMLIVTDSNTGAEFGYNVLQKLKSGNFAYFGRNIRKKDVSDVCAVKD